MTTATLAPSRPSPVMALLRSGVPLSLLLDLALGPDSRELFATEVPPQRDEGQVRAAR